MERRRYSDEEKSNALLALEANGGDASKTARELGIPRANLRMWLVGRGAHPAVAQQCQGKILPLAERLEEIARLLLDAIPDKIDGASLRDVSVSAAIAIDKAQLLRGEPTSIQQVDTQSHEGRADRVVSLLDSLRARRAG